MPCLCAVGLTPGLLGNLLGNTEEPPADPKTVAEYRIKAACLYRFAQFIEWPASAFSGEKAPLVFGVLGKDPFGEVLDQTLKGKTIAGRTIAIKRFASVKAIESCHMLFVSSSETQKLEEVFEATKASPTATVGEAEGFLKAGGIFRFFVQENKVQFEINKAAAKLAGLEISSKLLRLAK